MVDHLCADQLTFPFAGASLLALVVDDIALNQMARSALGFFASKLAPGSDQEPKKSPIEIR